MDMRQARFQTALPFQYAVSPLNAQAHRLQQIFNAHVTAQQGRFVFRDGACAEAFPRAEKTVVLSGCEARKNAAEAALPFFAAAGLSVRFDCDVNAGVDPFAPCVLLYLLHALYLGSTAGRISADGCAQQLSWLSQVPAQAESIFKYIYDIKWFTKIKALRGAMLFTGDGVGAALANESVRLMRGIASCRALGVQEAYSLLCDPGNSLLMAFVLSGADCAWAFPLLDLARENGLCAAAVTMHSLQAEVSRHTDACLPFPTAEAIAAAVLGIMPVQIFANDVALSKGLLTHSMLQ